MKKKSIILIVVVVIILTGIAFVGAKIYLRYSNPLMDISASYYEKTLNRTTANIGDVIEVGVIVYWHGYVNPEFTRDVKIIDPFAECCFTLAGGSNVHESIGMGGSYQFKYSLTVLGGEGASIAFQKPRLYLDNVEIPLNGTSPTLNISVKIEG